MQLTRDDSGCCRYIKAVEYSRFGTFLLTSTISYVSSILIIYIIYNLYYNIYLYYIIIILSLLYILESSYFIYSYVLNYREICNGLCKYCKNIRFNRDLKTYLCKKDNIIVCYNRILNKIYIIKNINTYNIIRGSKGNFSCVKFLGGSLDYGDINRYRGKALYPDPDRDEYMVEGEVQAYFMEVRLKGLEGRALHVALEKVMSMIGV